MYKELGWCDLDSGLPVIFFVFYGLSASVLFVVERAVCSLFTSKYLLKYLFNVIRVKDVSMYILTRFARFSVHNGFVTSFFFLYVVVCLPLAHTKPHLDKGVRRQEV